MKILTTKTLELTDGTKVTESNSNEYVALIAGVSAVALSNDQDIFSGGIVGDAVKLNELKNILLDQRVELDNFTTVCSVSDLVKSMLRYNREAVVKAVLQGCPEIQKVTQRQFTERSTPKVPESVCRDN